MALVAQPIYLDREAELFRCFEMDFRPRDTWLAGPRLFDPANTTPVELDELARLYGYAVEVIAEYMMLVEVAGRRR